MGTFGTMPAEDGTYAIHPGPHGGNLDDTNLTIGAVYHMPVFVPGAMIMVGDVHANQGDSEIAMGIEIDGTVTLRFVDSGARREHSLRPDRNGGPLGLSGRRPTLEDAVEQSALYAAEFLVERLDISMEDATYLLCAVGNVRISQAAFANYNVTVRTEVPKNVDRKGRLAGYADSARRRRSRASRWHVWLWTTSGSLRTAEEAGRSGPGSHPGLRGR